MPGEQSPAAAVGEIAVLVVAPTGGAQVAALQTARSEVAGLAVAEVAKIANREPGNLGTRSLKSGDLGSLSRRDDEYGDLADRSVR